MLNRGTRDHSPWGSRNNADGSSVPPSSAETYGKTTEHNRPAAALTAKTKLKKGSVVMVTASTGTGGFLGIPNLKEMVYENRMTYANKWGYNLMWANFTSYSLPNGEPIYWNKIPVLQEAFVRYPEAEWIWWLDIDIIIMNVSLSLYDHVLSREGMARNAVLDQDINKPGGGPSGWKTPATYDYDQVKFIINSGGWGMNVGNFIMRRSEWSDWLLDFWIDPLYIKEKWVLPENSGWTHMFNYHPIVRRYTVCTTQRAMNAYPEYNPLGTHWQPGDHSIHFAGCGNHTKCPGEWNKYWNLREKYVVPGFIEQQLKHGTAEIENIQKGVGVPPH